MFSGRQAKTTKRWWMSSGQANHSTILMEYRAVVKNYAVNIYSLTCKYANVKEIKKDYRRMLYSLFFIT